MSLIDDVVGKKLPTGRKFQAKVGSGNVQKKLYSATKSGALKNLADNQDLINKIAQKRQADIRSGRYTRDKRMADYREALKSGDLTFDDKKDLKAILEHWSRGEVSKTKAPEVKKPTQAQKRAQTAKASFRKTRVRELPDFLKKRASVSVNKNPWAGDSARPGAGGGIAAGVPSSKPKPNIPKPPTLMR